MLTLSNVSKSYGSSPPVLQQIDLVIDRGEFVSLIGPSGCGKSTLLKLISGLTSPGSGSILVDGMTPVQARKAVSYIFQDATLLPWRTVSRNVGLGLELEQVSRETRKQKVESLIELVGLSHVARAYPRQLSGGMKMRVSVARALATTPRLLLMDEPFGALDELTRMEMQDLLLDIRAKTGATVLFVTHSISEAIYLSDVVVVFSKRPAVIADYIEVKLPYPRMPEVRYRAQFTELQHRAGRALGITR